MTLRNSAANTVAAPWSSRGRRSPLRAAPDFRQRRRIRPPSARANDSRPWPAPSGTSSRSAGCSRRRPIGARIPSASTICRWSFSSAARWPTTSRISCSIPSSGKPSSEKNLDWLGLLEAGTRRGPGQRRARPPGGLLPRLDGHDAAPGHGLRPALRIRHVQARPSRTAGSRNSRTTGSAVRTPGRSRARTRRWKSS